MSAEYPFLNTIGVASINGVNPFLLIQLNKLGQQLGRPIDVFSGYRSPGYSERVGGYANDPHSRGEAVDAQIGGTPIGMVVPVATLAALGLEGGNTPGFYPRGGNGGRDPEHVQIPGSGVDKSMRSPALHLATGNPASGNVPPTSIATQIPNATPGTPVASNLPNATPGATPLQVIRDYAPRVGLDPAAVIAYALTQGGTSWGAVGDNGSSFGPFQMHIGGAAGNRSPAEAATWANSPQGLIDGMNMMAHAGATGKSGPEAAAFIVGPSFGRGANPTSDMAKARAAYPQAASLLKQYPGQAADGGATLVSGAALPGTAGTAPPQPVVPYVPPPPPDLPAYTPPPAATPITLLPAPPVTAATPTPTLRQGAPPPYDPANDRALAPAEPSGPLRRLYPVAKLNQAAAPLPGGGSGGPLRRLFPVSKLGRG